MKTKVGIIGGSGYTAGELLRLLLHHPRVAIDFVYSTTNAGKPIASHHQDLIGETELLFSDSINPEVAVIFLCLGHGRSRDFLDKYTLGKDTRIIDLGNDFRLSNDANYQKKQFVYGLPEWQKHKIEKAAHIANPGCFATAIQLALLPLAQKHKLSQAIHINATTGSSGAGVMPSHTTHFSWRSTNFSTYKVFSHQHLDEIKQNLAQFQKELPALYFVPNRGNFSKGIFATIYTPIDVDEETAVQWYQDFYQQHPFTIISDQPIHLKQVLNTNKCILHLCKKDGMLILTSILDNLIKGASGQAIQNMNLLFGWNETEGLALKGSAF